MDIVLANVSNLDFKIERDLVEQCGAIPLPFYGMDKSMAAVCQSLNTTHPIACEKGVACPFRHIRGDRTIVCKHWLRGLCKKGDQCEFLHEYDMKKMPECYFYSRFNACHNKECPFLHIDPESKVKDCPWYDRGFCRHGPHCRHRHVRRVLCTNYLAGFCMSGWDCKFMHPRFELPAISDVNKEQSAKKVPICHYCGELGHKASICRKNADAVNENKMSAGSNSSKMQVDANSDNMTTITPINTHFKDERMDESTALSGQPHQESYYNNQQQRQHHHHHQQQQQSQGNPMQQSGQQPGQIGGGFPRTAKPLEEVTCFKCGDKGHYANKCPKGHLAFLSNQRSHK